MWRRHSVSIDATGSGIFVRIAEPGKLYVLHAEKLAIPRTYVRPTPAVVSTVGVLIRRATGDAQLERSGKWPAEYALRCICQELRPYSEPKLPKQ